MFRILEIRAAAQPPDAPGVYWLLALKPTNVPTRIEVQGPISRANSSTTPTPVSSATDESRSLFLV
jgi:hypothetical protein